MTAPFKLTPEGALPTEDEAARLIWSPSPQALLLTGRYAGRHDSKLVFKVCHRLIPPGRSAETRYAPPDA
jgi:hypothetical protein